MKNWTRPVLYAVALALAAASLLYSQPSISVVAIFLYIAAMVENSQYKQLFSVKLPKFRPATQSVSHTQSLHRVARELIKENPLEKTEVEPGEAFGVMANNPSSQSANASGIAQTINVQVTLKAPGQPSVANQSGSGVLDGTTAPADLGLLASQGNRNLL
jgi:hypothetical protein